MAWGFMCYSCPLLDHSSGHQIKISCPKFCTVWGKKGNPLGPLRKPLEWIMLTVCVENGTDDSYARVPVTATLAHASCFGQGHNRGA